MESRAFAQEKAGKRYSLVLRPADKQNHQVDLTVRIVGEDSTDSIDIDSVTNDGKPVPFTHSGTINAVKLSAKKTTNLELTLAEPRRVSLEVTAHEN